MSKNSRGGFKADLKNFTEKYVKFYEKIPFGVPMKGAKIRACLEGDGAGDIKWNNMTGMFSIDLYNEASHRAIFIAGIKPFTGNCGIKAVDHLYVYAYGMDDKTREEFSKDCLKLLEGALYHATNCGILIGSDYVSGGSLRYVSRYGDGYQISEPVWNPNYTWKGSEDHKVQVFTKVLVGKDYDASPWNEIKFRGLPSEQTQSSF